MFKSDAELVFIRAGRDLFVRAGCHVWVHAHRHRRDLVHPRGDAVDALQFRLALRVEGIDSLFERKFDFTLTFANAGKGALLRLSARGQHPLQLAPAHNVEPAAEPRQRAQDGEVGVGLDSKADQVIHAGHRFVQLSEMPR